MLSITVIDSIPLFIGGLSQMALTIPGLRVVESGSADPVEDILPTDVVLLDPTTARSPSPEELIGKLIGSAPVLLLTFPPTDTAETGRLLRAGASGVLDRRLSQQSVLAVVWTAHEEWSGVHESVPTVEGSRLSEREQQVLDLISHGMTHRQTATRLGISHHTVDTYVKRIRSKREVGNKAQLTRLAIERPTAARPEGGGAHHPVTTPGP